MEQESKRSKLQTGETKERNRDWTRKPDDDDASAAWFLTASSLTRLLTHVHISIFLILEIVEIPLEEKEVEENHKNKIQK